MYVVRYAGDLGAVTEIWGGALRSVGAATPFNRLPTRTSGYFDPECIQFLWICGSRLQPPHPTLYISYWQIKALLMLAPSVVTPQNQYFPANGERMSVHCLESGCIGKYTPLGPRDFPRAGILHPEAREIAWGRSPRAISRAEGGKIPALGKSRGPRGVYFLTRGSVRTFFQH